MSTTGARERIGMLERLTSSTAFAVLLVLAGLILGPVLLLGLAALPMFLSVVPVTSKPEVWAVALLPLGGLIGVVGLVLTLRPPETSIRYGITLVCLAIGVATAIVLAATLVIGASAGDLLSVVTVPVLAVPVLAALGRVARLRRLRAAVQGRAQDALPLIFLGLALGELAIALAIGAQLASAG